MPRPKRERRIARPPLMMGYKPFGIPRKVLSELYLHFDEFEALRLLDYKGMTQEEAAKEMNVSRPTLTRIYDQARKTIAQAFVEGKMILIEGGKVEFKGDWYRCKQCHRVIQGLENQVFCKDCHTDGDKELKSIKQADL